jgi:hypothetical protein
VYCVSEISSIKLCCRVNHPYVIHIIINLFCRHSLSFQHDKLLISHTTPLYSSFSPPLIFIESNSFSRVCSIMAEPQRSWGVTGSISFARPTEEEVSANAALIEELKSQASFESAEESQKRLYLIQENACSDVSQGKSTRRVTTTHH